MGRNTSRSTHAYLLEETGQSLTAYFILSRAEVISAQQEAIIAAGEMWTSLCGKLDEHIRQVSNESQRRLIEYGQQLGHAQACERQARSAAAAATVGHMQNVEALSQHVHLAQVREWQATAAVEATNAELQYAPSVARADASKAIDAIRSQLPREIGANIG